MSCQPSERLSRLKIQIPMIGTYWIIWNLPAGQSGREYPALLAGGGCQADVLIIFRQKCQDLLDKLLMIHNRFLNITIRTSLLKEVFALAFHHTICHISRD
jgi:hypothetical protein